MANASEGLDFSSFGSKKPEKKAPVEKKERTPAPVTPPVTPPSPARRTGNRKQDVEQLQNDFQDFKNQWAAQLMMLQAELGQVSPAIDGLQSQVTPLAARQAIEAQTAPERKALLTEGLNLVTLLRRRYGKAMQEAGYENTRAVADRLAAVLVEALG